MSGGFVYNHILQTGGGGGGNVSYDGTHSIPAQVASTGTLGTPALPFAGVDLSATGLVSYGANATGYTNGTGPEFNDSNTGNVLTFDFSLTTTNRTYTFPDVTGTLALAAANPPIAAPTTGQTVNVVPTGAITVELVEPAGALAALTVTANNGATPGQIFYITINQAITTLTWGGTNFVATALPLPAAVAATATYGFVWNSAASKWNRFQ